MRRLSVILVSVLALAACGGAAAQEGAAGDTIGVRGHWTIEVLDPDGTVAHEVEFDNAFVGQQHLADLLSMTTTQTGWNIQALPAVGGDLPLCSSNSGGCGLDAEAERDTSTNELVVSGSFTAELTGELGRVASNLVVTPGGNRTFSLKDLTIESSGPVPVEAGQIVQIEIRYSFATA